jgi:hypothetical protein
MPDETMDQAHARDSQLERDLREQARELDDLSKRRRIQGTSLAGECRALAVLLRAEADTIVRVWD